MAEQASTAPGAADLLMEVANIRTEQKRPREAEAQLRRILGMLPEPTAPRAAGFRGAVPERGALGRLAARSRSAPTRGWAPPAPDAERPQLLREPLSDLHGKLQRGLTTPSTR